MISILKSKILFTKSLKLKKKMVTKVVKENISMPYFPKWLAFHRIYPYPLLLPPPGLFLTSLKTPKNFDGLYTQFPVSHELMVHKNLKPFVFYIYVLGNSFRKRQNVIRIQTCVLCLLCFINYTYIKLYPINVTYRFSFFIFF